MQLNEMQLNRGVTSNRKTVELPVVEPQTEARPRSRIRPLWWLLLLAVLAGLAYWLLHDTAKTTTTSAAAPVPVPAVPVIASTAREGDMPIILTGLGSVTAFNTDTIKSRVDGELTNVAFKEGQFVHQGDLLAEIDPRPFQVQLAQAEGQLARDQAQLKDAQINLDRFKDLVAKEFISKQQYDDQAAQVGNFEGAVKADQANIDNAKLQLTYSRIIAPISGRVGLRLVDVGNMVHASDPNGLVVITQVQPIAVLFTIPEDNLPPVLKKLHSGDQLSVEAYDRSGKVKIATGSLLTVDNQIDPTTGTSRLKAVFANDDNQLFPNQFVNVKLLLDVRKNVTIVPAAAVQRGPQGTFVYVIKDNKVELRPVTVGPVEAGNAMIESGLSVGEVVVTDGVDKLRAGSSVQVKTGDAQAASGAPRT